MDRFFDLQRFENVTNLTPGKAGEPNIIPTVEGGGYGFNSSDNIINLANYVSIVGGGGNDTILSSGSSHVSIDAGTGDDVVTSSAMTDIQITVGAGDSTVDVVNSNDVGVKGDEGKDTVVLLGSSKVNVNSGAGDDNITIGEGSKNVTVTTGDGKDVITFNTKASNVTVTDLSEDDTLVLDGLDALPGFAVYKNGVLNLDGVNITVGNDFNTETAVTVAVGTDTVSLADLLDSAPPYWEVGLNGGKTALTGAMTYYSAQGEVLATVTNLNAKALTPVATELGLVLKTKTAAYDEATNHFESFPGIAVDANNNIVVSQSLLPTAGTVSLAVTPAGKDFNFALADGETTFTTTGDAKTSFGLAVKGADKKVKTATYTSKVVSNGYYVGDDGKKIKFVKANATATAFTIGNLATNTSVVAASASNTLSGVDFEITGNTGTVTISDSSKFSTVKGGGKGVSVGGEDVTFNITDANFASIVGAATDDHIIFSGGADSVTTITAAAGNDWITDNGVKDKIDLGAGNDFMLGNYSSNTILAGAGNDYVYVAGNSNTVHGAAGNDTLEVAGGEGNTVNADAGNNLILVSDSSTAVTGLHVLAAKGNDTVSISGGGVVEGATVYNFTNSTVNSGAGNDYLALDFVSDTAVIASAGNNTLSFNGVGGGITLGGGIDIVNINYASDTAVVTGAGNDTVNFNGLGSEISLGAGNDALSIDSFASDTSVIADAGNDTLTISGSAAVDFFTFDGGAGIDTAVLSDSAVSDSTILMDAGNDIVSVIGGSGSGNVINTGLGDDKIIISDTAITGSTISAGVGKDVISVVSGADYKGNVFQYDYGNGDVTISGFTDKDLLQIAGSGENVTVPADVTKVAVDGTEKAALVVNVGAGKAAGKITLVDYTTDTTTIASKIVKNSDALDNQITWSVKVTNFGKANAAATATGTLKNGSKVTLTGLNAKGASGETAADVQNKVKAALSDNGDRIIIGADALDSSTAVTKAITLDKTGIGLGYKLTLGDDVTEYGTEDKGWTFTEEDDRVKAVCNGVEVTPGFELDKTTGAKITYNKGDDEVALPTITGLAGSVSDYQEGGSLAGALSFNVDTVTLSEGALPAASTFEDGTTDTGIKFEGDGFKFALGADVTEAEFGKMEWKFDVDGLSDTSTTDLTARANYDTAFVTAGYSLTDNGKGISYSTDKGSETLVTVCGLKLGTAKEQLSVDEETKVITIDAKALPKKTNAIDPVAVYIDETNAYDEYVGSEYTLAIGKGATAAKVTVEGWKANGTTSYYQTRMIAKNGYAVSEDGKSIDWYDDEFGGNTVLTLTGLKAKAGTGTNLTFDTDTNVITIKAAALGKTDIELEVGEDFVIDTAENPNAQQYTLALEEGISAPSRTDDAWSTISGGVQFITGKTTEGYEVDPGVYDEVAETYVSGGQRIIYTAASAGTVASKITGLAKGTAAADAVAFNNNISDTVVLQVGKIATNTAAKGATVVGADYAYELSGTVGGSLHNGSTKGTNFVGSAHNDSLYGNAGRDILSGGEGNDYLSGGNGNDSLFGGAGKDILVGGNGNDSLYSGEGTGDSLHGGNGNDVLTAEGSETTLTGGNGKDVFIHSGTSTTITDYAAGADKIVSSKTLTGATVKIDGKDVVFTLAGEGGTITVKNGKNKVLTLIDTSEGSEAFFRKQKYVAEGEANLAEVWFDDDSELFTADSLSNITETEVIGDELESSKPEKLTQENLVTYGG